jgi:hypothetical protein
VFRCRFFLDSPQPVREDLLVTTRFFTAHETARLILDERRYARAEIWRDGRLVGALSADLVD